MRRAFTTTEATPIPDNKSRLLGWSWSESLSTNWLGKLEQWFPQPMSQSVYAWDELAREMTTLKTGDPRRTEIVKEIMRLQISMDLNVGR